MAKLVAWRRKQRVPNTDKLVSAYTVNDTTEQLRKLFTFMKHRGVRFDREPKWRAYWLKEPEERVRELVGDEGDRLRAAMRDDFAPFFQFVHATGWRRNECMTLKWSEVNWDTNRITKPGKGDRRVSTIITSEVRSILDPLRNHHPEFVFTYIADRTRDGRVKGQRYPLTKEGVKTAWTRLRKKAGVVGFRFHDFRHDFGSKLLRETGNLKLVQKAMGHADLKTTSRYAHVLDEDVAAALERHAESRSLSRSDGLNIDEMSDKTA